MNTLIFNPTNYFQLNYHSKQLFPEENLVHGFENNPDFDEFSLLSNEFSSPVDGSSSEGEISKEFSVQRTEPSPADESEGEIFKENDHSNAMMTFISQMLMEEEELENTPDMLHDSLALQATEKSLYDVLYNNHLNQNTHSSNSQSSGSSSDVGSFAESNWNQEKDFGSLLISSSLVQDTVFPVIPSDLQSLFWSSNSLGLKQPEFESNVRNLREKKNRHREGDLIEEKRSNKQLANNTIGEFEPPDLFDKVLLCSKLELAGAMPPCGEIGETKAKKQQMHQNERPKGSSNRGRPKGGKKQGIIKEVVDLRSLLMSCAQAMASYDSRTVNDLLMRIRQHSSPHGDGAERVAHYFANAIEARLAGTGPASYAGASYHCLATKISAADILKAYQTFIIACPFRKMSNVMANKTIKKLAMGPITTLHVIDFGILYGYQWPCLIQALSERPGGPPKLRITGIDFPQPGFRPAERVEESGNRLKRYCERFGVPFEYIAIAQKWETIKVEDLKIEKNETIVVNSLYRLDNVPDETVTVNSPRDAVLNLIRKINPNLFILGILNGTYNTPFFVTRFREALFHFSAMFDMFEATTPRDDEHRILFEQEVLGKDAMNVIACEGTERVNRPETYKQWQIRNKRVGFRQVPLDQELVKYVRYRVKMDYNKDFSVDEDGKWMLQGWKGRVIHALSFWQPKQK